MIDYKTFKKEYLTEWVDRSQAARKAAEELANKEVIPSLRDRYARIFDLDGHKVEFKGENEKNPNDPKYNLFTYDEAIKRFGEFNKEGWRLPSYEELEALCSYSYRFENKQGIFDNRLYLPAAGYRGSDGNVISVGSLGNYWTSTPDGSSFAWNFCFYSGKRSIYRSIQSCGFSVHLVRDVK